MARHAAPVSRPSFQDGLKGPLPFGLRYMPALLSKAVSPMHREWNQLALEATASRPGRDRLNLQAHRESGKSTFWAIVYPMWRLCLWLWLRKQGAPAVDEHIGIGAVTQPEANARLSQIKMELEKNRLLIEDFRPTRGETWTKTDLLLGAARDIKNPTLFARGIMNSPPGVRMTAYIGDDLVDPFHVFARDQRNKVEFQLDEIIENNMLENAPIILTHTTYHGNDLPNRKAKDASWHTRKWPLVIDLEKKLVQWPENWPWERVVKRMKKPLIFARQYQLKDEPTEGRLLPIPKFYPREALTYIQGRWCAFGLPLRISIGVDPATKYRDTKSGSRTAIVVIGFTAAWDAFVLQVRCGRWDPDKTWSEIIDAWKVWHPIEVFIEEVAFSNVFAKMLSKDTPVPARGVSAKGDKVERIIGELNPPLHSGKLKFIDKGGDDGMPEHLKADNTEEALVEITEFVGDTLDCCDAAAIAYGNGIRSKAFATAGTPKVGNSVRDQVRGMMTGADWLHTEYGD